MTTPPDHERYPIWMTHPNYWPGSVGTEQTDGSGFKHPVGGLPARFPPILAENADQEERYAAKGYNPAGKSDPTAYLKLQASFNPGDYRHQDYPKDIGGGVVVANAEEEAAALAKPPPSQPAPAAVAQPSAETPQPAHETSVGESDADRIARLEHELAAAKAQAAPASPAPAKAPAKAKPPAKPKARPKRPAAAPVPSATAMPPPSVVELPPARRRIDG